MAADGTEAVVDVRGLTTRFGAHTVHEGLDLQVRRGEVLAIAGGSGSGKSTLLRAMLRLNPVAGGRVQVLGQDVARLSESALAPLRRRVGVLFQYGALFSDLTVADNVAFPLREHTALSREVVERLVGVKLALVTLRADSAALYPSELSGGMRKRAGLARALALDPELLFLDEPTSGLDPIGAATLDRLILDLRHALNLTVVMVSHDLASMRRAADRVVLLAKGRIYAEGRVEELARSDDAMVRAFFQGSLEAAS